MCDWIFEFVCGPLSGDPSQHLICPGLPSSIERELTFCAVCNATDEASVARELEFQHRAYRSSRNILSEMDRGKLALLVLFPSLRKEHLSVLRRFKQEMNDIFAAEGLACREFYPGNDDRSLRDPNVRIADAPIAAFGFRPSQPHDGKAWETRRSMRHSDDSQSLDVNVQRMRSDYRILPPGELPWTFGTTPPELCELIATGVIAPCSTVVDLGCGEGSQAVFLAVQGMKVIGVDILPDALQFARRLAEHYGVAVEWKVANALEVPLRDSAADVVLDSFVFHHLRDEARERYAREVHRVLRPDGLFVLRAYSDRGPVSEGPRRLSSRTILATFEPYFECERLELVTGLSSPRKGRPPIRPTCWFCLFRRTE